MKTAVLNLAMNEPNIDRFIDRKKNCAKSYTTLALVITNIVMYVQYHVNIQYNSNIDQLNARKNTIKKKK